MKDWLIKYRFWINCWGIVFGISAVVFSCYMMTFYIGNHDFPFMRYGVSLNSGMWEGRLTQFVLPYFLFKGQILPILVPLMGVMFYAGAAVFLAKMYGFPEKSRYVLPFSLLIVLHPFVCSQLYYVHTIVSILAWHLFAVWGAMFAWYFANNYKCFYGMMAIFCLWFSMGGYAPVLETILVISAGKFLIDVLDDKSLDKSFFVKFVVFAIVLLLGIAAYTVSIEILKKTGVLSVGMYNVQTHSFKNVIGMFVNFWYEPFKVLMMAIPNCSILANVLLLLIAILSFVVFVYKKRLLWGSVAFFVLIQVAFVLIYISPFAIFRAIRIHAMSVPYVAAVLFAVACLYGTKFVKNLAFLGAVGLIVAYINADLVTQKIWYLGTEQDERVVDRVREELIPKLEKGKHYRLSSVGSFYGRQKFAGIEDLSNTDREIYREYYGYGMYLYVFFSSGLFLFEKENPILGDIEYLGNYLRYRVVNESVGDEDKNKAFYFARRFGMDKDKLISAVEKNCAYPCQNFYYVGEKDIILMVSNDEISRLILKWNIEKEMGI